MCLRDLKITTINYNTTTYGYDYDRLNRLQFADFSQKGGGSYADDAIINFDIQIGTISGGVWSNDYDENGNILKMKQWGVRINSNTVVDDLSYNYLANSNKLKNVIDASNEPATVMGDFRSSQTYMTALGGVKTASAVDYGYDLNGNLKKDLNKAYINWVLLDEQFRVVSGNCGFDPVDDVAGKIKSHHQAVSISKSGYLYVYCSNESNIDVLFDNLQLIHTRGPLLETDEYYPFGGTAFAISYKAALSPDNNYKLSGNELQANEFAAGTGLEFYDFNARMYDAQIGRFMAVDPLADNMPDWNPYGFAFDNPVYFVDPSGLEPYPPPGAGDDDYRDDGGPDGDMYDFSKPGFPGMFENDESTQRENLDNVTLESYKGFDVRNFDFENIEVDKDENSQIESEEIHPQKRGFWGRLWEGYKKADRWVGEHGGDWINENINPVTPFAELITGRQFKQGDFTTAKPRLQSATEAVIPIINNEISTICFLFVLVLRRNLSELL